ncbi:MAG: DUF6515 family protein [Planctomycetota bacterium]|jgi:hypothetical protein
MRSIRITPILALVVVCMLASDGPARGTRGGGFHGAGRRMGSVRYHHHYQPRHYDHTQHARRAPPRHDHGGYHRPAAHPQPGPRPTPLAWGTRVNRLPHGYRRRWWRNRFWYYGAGMWYVEDDDEYTATRPPIGMIVDALPDGAVRKKINGKTYYEYNGVWFRPVCSSGATRYAVVQSPE